MALTGRIVPSCALTAAAATVTSSPGAAFAALVFTDLSEWGPGEGKGLCTRHWGLHIDLGDPAVGNVSKHFEAVSDMEPALRLI